LLRLEGADELLLLLLAALEEDDGLGADMDSLIEDRPGGCGDPVYP
jgi:hypothetical protein